MSEQEHIILGLDLGSTLGWCLVKNSVIVQSGVFPLKFKDAHPADRFIRFKEFLFKFRGVHEVVFEEISFHTSRDQSRVWDGMRALLMVFCYEHRVRLLGVPNATMKKEFAGHGKADKVEMCAVAHRMGWKHGEPGTDLDHDEVDAIAAVVTRLKRQGTACRFK